MRLPSGPAKEITTRSAKVLSVTDTVPKTRNCRNMCPLARFTNCGMNERKKSAVFGFRTSVVTPCQKGLGGEA